MWLEDSWLEVPIRVVHSHCHSLRARHLNNQAVCVLGSSISSELLSVSQRWSYATSSSSCQKGLILEGSVKTDAKLQMLINSTAVDTATDDLWCEIAHPKRKRASLVSPGRRERADPLGQPRSNHSLVVSNWVSMTTHPDRK